MLWLFNFHKDQIFIDFIGFYLDNLWSFVYTMFKVRIIFAAPIRISTYYSSIIIRKIHTVKVIRIYPFIKSFTMCICHSLLELKHSGLMMIQKALKCVFIWNEQLIQNHLYLFCRHALTICFVLRLWPSILLTVKCYLYKQMRNCKITLAQLVTSALIHMSIFDSHSYTDFMYKSNLTLMRTILTCGLLIFTCYSQVNRLSFYTWSKWHTIAWE